MDFIDLLRALPGLLVIGLLPGVALASLVRPSMPGWWRLAMAPGLSCGIVGVIGLLDHDAHVPFELRTVLPALAVLGVAAVVRAVSHPAAQAHPGLPLRSRAGLLILAGGLLAGLLSAAILASALRVAPLPIAGDAPIHGTMVRGIATGSDVMTPLSMPVAGTASVRARPAMEAAAALVAGMGGMRPVSAMLPLTLLAVLLLPLSLAVLMSETAGDWRMAAVVPLLGVGFTLMTFAVRFGEYPYVVDLTLVVPMIVSARRALLGRELRREAAMIVAVVAAVWALHGLEIVTAVVIGAPLAVATVLGLPRREVLFRAAVVAGAVALGALAVTLVTRVPAQPAAVFPPGVRAATQESVFLGVWGSARNAPHAFADFVGTEMAGGVAVIPYVLGLIAAVRIKGMRWALVAHGLLLLILADVAYAVVLRRLWTPLFPWSVIDRVVSIQWFVVPLIATWGLFHVRPALNLGGAVAQRPLGRVLVAAVVVAAALTPVVGGAYELQRIRSAVAGEDVTSDADLAALTAMDRLLPRGTIVLTQGKFDSGQWTDAVTRDLEWAPLAYSRGVFENGMVPPIDDRARAVGHACEDPAAARAALHGIGAVYLGAVVLDGSPAPFSARCIEALPGVSELVRATVGGRTALVLRVQPGA